MKQLNLLSKIRQLNIILKCPHCALLFSGSSYELNTYESQGKLIKMTAVLFAELGYAQNQRQKRSKKSLLLGTKTDVLNIIKLLKQCLSSGTRQA